MKKKCLFVYSLLLCSTMAACGKGNPTTSNPIHHDTISAEEPNTSSSTAPTPSDHSSQQKDTETQKQKLTYHLYTGEIISLPAPETTDASYEVANHKIASLSNGNILHALKAGKTTVTFSVNNQKTNYTIIVKKHGMVYPTFSMMKGEHLDLQFSNGTKVKNWKSSNKKIASVTKNGMIKAKKVGKTTIIGRANGHTYQCNVKVTKKQKKIIYLTFDDGPNRYTTPKVLNILKKNHVKATFFELKPAKKDFDLTERVIKEGHTLAMHGYQHKYNIVYRSVNIYHDNLDRLQKLFFQKFGVWCTITRFPGGSSNMVSRYNPGVMTRITQQIHDWGYHYFDWNVGSGDSDGAKTPAAVFNNFKRQLSSSHANVVLMHDYRNNDVMLGALDKMIKYGKKHGYTFLPITASTEAVHHRVNN